MTLLGIAILAPLLWMVVFASRRGALLALFAGVLYLTTGQSVAVFGVDMYATRLLMLAAFVRVILRGELGSSQLNDLDKTLLVVFGYRLTVFILNGNGSAMTEIGYFADTALSYFAFRGFIREPDDLLYFLERAPLLLLPYAALSSIERWTGSNVFAPLGGITEGFFERDGIPRVSGSFAHPATFGTFGAALLPLYIAFAGNIRNRAPAIAGVAACVAIVVLSNSGGPASAAAVALMGSFAWRLRTQMRVVRWVIAAAIVFLGAMMKAPIWYLPAKVSGLMGGDGWHRSYLLQVSFEHLDVWWFAGMNEGMTRSWFPYFAPATGGADIINYYIDFGIAAGLISMGLFIYFLKKLFGQLGDAMRLLRSGSLSGSMDERILWGLGVALSVHMVNWFAIVYFDKMHLFLCMQLAVVSSAVMAVGKAFDHQSIASEAPDSGSRAGLSIGRFQR